MHWRLEKALRPLKLTLKEAGHVHASGGTGSLARYAGDRVRLVALSLLHKRQSEEELVRVTMRYWNEGDKTGVDLKDYSHWVGAGPWKDLEKWRSLGRVHREMYEQLCLLTGTRRPLKGIVEWGAGGGANAIHFINECEVYCGVEIARASLDECGRVLAEAQFPGFQPVLISADNPEQALELAPGPFDLFLSTYVYELLPGRNYAERVTRIAWQMLRPGGLALIQVRYDDGSPRNSQKHADYFRQSSRFTSYRVEEFWTMAEKIGFRCLHVILVPEKIAGFSGDRYAYFALIRPA